MEDPYSAQGKMVKVSERSSSKDGINTNSILNPMDPAYQRGPNVAGPPSRGTHIETNS